MQVWRPLRGPVHDSPLGLLDAATVAKEDLLSYSLIFPERKGYNYAAQYNRNHRQVHQSGCRLSIASSCVNAHRLCTHSVSEPSRPEKAMRIGSLVGACS